MQTQVATTTTKAVTTHNQPTIDTRDLSIPEIRVLSKSSKAVEDGKGKAGDIMNSLTEKVLADTESWAKLVFLKWFKTIDHMKEKDGQMSIEKTEAWKPEFYDLPRMEYKDKNGDTVRHVPVYNFYILFDEDVKNNDAFPCLIQFKKSNQKVGERINTQLMLALNAGKHQSSKSFKIRSEKKVFKNITYYTYCVQPDGEATKEVLDSANYWLKILNQGGAEDVDIDPAKEEIF